MADEKNSIIVYADWIDKFEELTDDEAGRLIKHFFRYVNDQDPVAPDRITKLAFMDIEKSLKRDLKKWEAIKQKRSDAGKASAEAKKLAKESEQSSTKSTSVESVQQSSTKSTVSVSVNDSVSVSVNEITINSYQREILDKILIFFKYQESSFHKQQSLAFSFVYSLPHNEKLEMALKQIPAYIELKSLDKFPHGFDKFLGSQKERFLDGLWNDNWIDKLKAYKIKNGMQTDSVKKKTGAIQRWKEQNGQA